MPVVEATDSKGNVVPAKVAGLFHPLPFVICSHYCHFGAGPTRSVPTDTKVYYCEFDRTFDDVINPNIADSTLKDVCIYFNCFIMTIW